MRDSRYKKAGPTPRVNMGGIPMGVASQEITATISILSEGTTLCDECGMAIYGRCVYLTRPEPSRYDGYVLVSITHPRCYGVADDE
ncbi:MAG: hypothetical protein M3Q49_19905 [Actinomycetota bacterium]|nr:hypothetical protein [Actinomycetota bacterium]